jgi:hypothetical protein
VAQVAALVVRLGWEEFLWHVGQILGTHYDQAQGPHKGALKAARDTINTFVNSVRIELAGATTPLADLVERLNKLLADVADGLRFS